MTEHTVKECKTNLVFFLRRNFLLQNWLQVFCKRVVLVEKEVGDILIFEQLSIFSQTIQIKAKLPVLRPYF